MDLDMQDQEQTDALAMLGADANFDEVLPEPIDVEIIEFEDYETTQGNRKMRRRRPVKRIASINTYVPMKIFHRMLASQEKVRRFQQLMQQSKNGQAPADAQGEMIQWLINQVLSVWQLSEPDMTADALEEGLSMTKILFLFNLFFAEQLKNLGQRQRL